MRLKFGILTSLMIATRPVLKPAFESVPLAVGLAWRGGGAWRFEEKMDGEYSVRKIDSARLVGEQMRSGGFYTFDIIEFSGQDLRGLPLGERLMVLDEVIAHQSSLRRPATGSGGEFLETILARGGEGIVAKRLDQPFGALQFKCKRLQTFFCSVTGFVHGKNSVSIAEPGSDRGHVALFGGKIDRVRIGSVLKVEGFGLTPAGRIREPRLCKDSQNSWLLQY